MTTWQSRDRGESLQPDFDTKVHVAAQVPFKESWLATRINFEELGWEWACSRLKGALTYLSILRHRLHVRTKTNLEGCCFCMTVPNVGLEKLTDRTIYLAASREAEVNEGAKRLAGHYTLHDNVWYCHSRLEKEGPAETRDFDYLPFYDASQIKKVLPIVPTLSSLFRAHLAHVHVKVTNHAGVENTFKAVKEFWLPIGGVVRAVILAFRKKCYS